jgi:hypothetical protein
MISIRKNVLSYDHAGFLMCCNDRDGKIMPKGTFFSGGQR